MNRKNKIDVNFKNDVILSIHPKYNELIQKYEKKFEFRKRVFMKPINNIYLYTTSPIKKITGWFPYNGYYEGSVEEIWEKCQEYAGLDKDEYLKYFSGNSIAFAFIIMNFISFIDPIDPQVIFPEFRPPQSYCYFRRA